MKLLILIISFLTLGCGVSQDFNENCGGDGRVICDFMFGDPDKDYDDRLDDIEKRLDYLESQYYFLSDYIDSLEEVINEVDSDVQDLKQRQDDAQQELDYLTAELTEIKGYDYPIEYIDPCGDGPGFDEVIIKTKSGKLIVYFEQGNGAGNQKRFLTELSPGSYVTTDPQECSFSVNNDREIIDE